MVMNDDGNDDDVEDTIISVDWRIFNLKLDSLVLLLLLSALNTN